MEKKTIILVALAVIVIMNIAAFLLMGHTTHIFQETFDVIYSTLTMMHFQDKSSVIGKISALLSDGGLVCLSIDKNQSEWIDMGIRRIRIYPDTPQQIIASAEQAGLKAKRVVEIENAHIVVLVK